MPEEQFYLFILNLDRTCLLKILLIYSSGDSFVQQSRTTCEILVEGIMRNNSVKLFLIWTNGLVHERMSFKGISYLELWWPLCSATRNHLCNFGRRHHEEQFCEIILKEQFCEIIMNLDQWFRRGCCLKAFII